MITRQLFVGTLAALLPVVATAAIEVGGDIRYRLVDQDSIPLDNVGHGNPDLFTLDSTFYRFRTRVWGDYRIDPDTRVFGRVANEFRNSWGADRDTSWEAPDEIVVDNFYIDTRGGRWNVRLGRQDLYYGGGRIIADGTPLDDSRTGYFNAIKASLELPKNTLDFLAIYNVDEDPLAINSQDRQLLNQGLDGESAVGAYWVSSMAEALPFEAYSIFKTERVSGGEDNEFTTYGARLLPKLTPNFSMHLELAFQSGDYDAGNLIDLAVSYRAGTSMDPEALAGYYRLSGDNPSTGGDEGWHQVFGRDAQISELYSYALTVDQGGYGYWTNLIAPYVGLGLSPIPDSRLTLRLYRLEADQPGPGEDDGRGLLFTGRFDFPIAPRLSGHVLHEWLMPGDYYAGNMDDDAHFSRLELSYRF